MSPDPVTVNVPAAARNRPPRAACCGSICCPAQARPGPAPARLTWSNEAVAWLGLSCADCPPKDWDVIVCAGEAANSPACTVPGSPARWAVPTRVQCVPSAES